MRSVADVAALVNKQCLSLGKEQSGTRCGTPQNLNVTSQLILKSSGNPFSSSSSPTPSADPPFALNYNSTGGRIFRRKGRGTERRDFCRSDQSLRRTKCEKTLSLSLCLPFATVSGAHLFYTLNHSWLEGGQCLLMLAEKSYPTITPSNW